MWMNHSPKKQVHDLRVLLDPHLLLNKQVEAVAREAFAKPQLMCQLLPFLEWEDQAK